jgi:NAD-dependent SIR2 family protein deacetylase
LQDFSTALAAGFTGLHGNPMRLLPDGPDIPAELIAAQEKGDVLFVCGAGVSRTVGLPSFRGLVESVYWQLSEDWNQHPAEREGMRDGGALHAQYDRVLRSLERRLAASDAPRHSGMRERIRGAVRAALAPPSDAQLVDHLTLLKLSRDAEGRSRVLTTNFDTLFERAWCDAHHQRPNSYAGPAMPQPKVDAFTGVLHLHGRLADVRDDLNLTETDLILTSAEFGDAYLRSGWASRYVYDVVLPALSSWWDMKRTIRRCGMFWKRSKQIASVIRICGARVRACLRR